SPRANGSSRGREGEPASALARFGERHYLWGLATSGKPGMLTFIVIVAIVAVLALMLVGTYNRLVKLRQNTNEAFADIDVQLKQRQDLVPNLVETVKGYAAHERGTLDEVTAARTAATSATSVEGKIAAENALTGALGRLMAVAEAYPDL